MRALPIYLILMLVLILRANTGRSQLILQTFPELENKKIQQLSIIDSSSVVVLTENILWKWNGKKWRMIEPQFPFKNVLIHFIKALSFNNIWVFFKKHNEVFHTHIYHFNGFTWKNIFNPSAYQLDKFSFYRQRCYFSRLIADPLSAR